MLILTYWCYILECAIGAYPAKWIAKKYILEPQLLVLGFKKTDSLGTCYI